MSTTNRIVLLTPQGEELFSGDSMLSDAPPPPALSQEERMGIVPVAPLACEEVEEDEPIPETLRSSQFVRAHEPVSRPIIVEEAVPGHCAA